jgi:hypothetical protein
MQEFTTECTEECTTKTRRTRSLNAKAGLEFGPCAYSLLAVFPVFANFRFDCTRPLDSNLRVLCVFVVKFVPRSW